MVKMGLFTRKKAEERHREAIRRIANLYRGIIRSEHHVYYDLRKAHHLASRERELRSRLKSLDKLKDAKSIGEEARRIIREERQVINDMETYANKALRRIRLQKSKIRAMRRSL